MKKGLARQEAEQLLREHGPNVIVENEGTTIVANFISQLTNVLVLFLLLAVFISFAIGHAFDGFLILTIVIFNALFGVYQEKKANDAIKSLKTLTITKVRVLRNEKQVEIDSREIVPGDLVYVEEGAKVPADGTVIEQTLLEVDESALTGESAPVRKNTHDQVAMGTIVVKGKGYITVTATGMDTKFGQIARDLSSVEETQTPLQKKLLQLSRTIGLAGIGISIVVFGITITGGHGYLASFLLAVSLAVAMAPEALPVVMTIALALGVKEMADKKAIVRKLSAIEALGSLTLIATDKTGTLTTNQMSVSEMYLDGKGYERGTFPPISDENMNRLLLAGALCSTASLVYVHNKAAYDVLGDPTEGSLLLLAHDVGIDYEQVRREWRIVNEKPFDSVTKLMSVEVVHQTQGAVSFTKGALESIISNVQYIEEKGSLNNFQEKHVRSINAVAEQWAKRGLRVMAFSYQKDENKEVFLGMVALQDPPRPEVADAIARARKAHITVVMITGDNEKTAEAIGTQVGLLQEGDTIVTGAQIETYSDEELMKKLPNVRIFARTNPFQKSRIVSLYQKLGEVVAVTGDGVNDAIALKQADVGVAMGLVGTDVAREAADMVITDDNFATIITAVDEGKNIIHNLTSAIKYLLATNFSEGITLVASLLMGIPALLVPVQLLYVNLIGDGLPALTLAFGKREERGHSVQESTTTLLRSKDIAYIVFISIAASALIIGAYLLFLSSGVTKGRTAAFSVLAIVQAFIFADLWMHNQGKKKGKKFITAPFIAVFMFPIILQLILLNVPLFTNVFMVESVSLFDFGIFVTISALITVGIRVIRNLKFEI